MPRWIPVLPALLFLAAAASSQSLGDVARETREKQKSKSATAKKVITNETLPVADDSSSPSAGTGTSQPAPSQPASTGGKQPASDWKNRIQAQKSAVANLQEQIDKLNASIHFVEANAYYNGVQYNEAQVRKQQQVEQMRQQLAEQKKRLEEMQEAARGAGMGSAVYDP